MSPFNENGWNPDPVKVAQYKQYRMYGKGKGKGMWGMYPMGGKGGNIYGHPWAGNFCVQPQTSQGMDNMKTEETETSLIATQLTEGFGNMNQKLDGLAIRSEQTEQRVDKVEAKLVKAITPGRLHKALDSFGEKISRGLHNEINKNTLRERDRLDLLGITAGRTLPDGVAQTTLDVSSPSCNTRAVHQAPAAEATAQPTGASKSAEKAKAKAPSSTPAENGTKRSRMLKEIADKLSDPKPPEKKVRSNSLG